ncbi:MAG: hypothetical protein EOP43_06655 [Sphingobacteriaceae bacterium]|nr:MAG: hypothetical protein EOP43_06655 [Sphingobacteriaceae bacterium]
MEQSFIFLGIIIALIILLIGYLSNNPDTSSIDISFYQFKVLVKKSAVSRKNSVARKIVRRRQALKQKAKEIKEADSAK